MGVQLTPGQRCLLEILQRKLIETLKEYARVNQERDSYIKSFGREKPNNLHERDLRDILRDKIKRISGRQKRFTSEIVNGNGNNTIPKESFLRALGLVTRETLQQINSKSNERRRRTTANPRFSHEAIRAKKALQKPRIEPRATREKREQQPTDQDKTAAREKREQLTEQDRTEFYNEFKQLGIYFQLRAEEIRKKLKSKEELNDDLKFRAMLLREFNGKTGCNRNLACLDPAIMSAVSPPQLENWMRCDESLDGLTDKTCG